MVSYHSLCTVIYMEPTTHINSAGQTWTQWREALDFSNLPDPDVTYVGNETDRSGYYGYLENAFEQDSFFWAGEWDAAQLHDGCLSHIDSGDHR